jgi:hypothetical protein
MPKILQNRMTNERKRQLEQIDVAILAVLSRTRKKIIVFDDPELPRNAASASGTT